MHSIKASFATISLLVLFIFACAAYIANAQETTTPQERFQELRIQVGENQQERFEARASSTEDRQEMRIEAQENREELRASTTEARAAIKEERRTMLAERSQTRITNLAANISNRIDAAVGRLGQIIERMEARMDLLDEQEVDTTAARVALETAREAVEDAAEAVTGIDEKIEEVIGSEDPREAWEVVRTVYGEVKESLQTAQNALRESLSLLKDAVREAGIGNGVSDAVRNGAPKTDEANEEETEETE